MRALYLHIGLGKTGSSALQSWLSLNSRKLARQGFDYADLVPRAKFGETSSGNGMALVRALRESDAEETERLLTSIYFFNDRNHKAIVSSEMLKGVETAQLEMFSDACRRNAINVRVIAFVRSVYERAYSAYGENVKKSGEAKAFSRKHLKRNLTNTLEYLRKYAELFGEDMQLLNYDDPDRDIFEAFAMSIGFRAKRLKKLKTVVNRSLNENELAAQRLLNKLHGGIFSTRIAKHIIQAFPGQTSPTIYDPDLIEWTRANTRDEIQWINDTFNLEPPLVPDLYDGLEVAPDPTPVEAILLAVSDWALEFSPDEDLRGEYRDFLAGYANLMKEYSEPVSHRLAARVHEI